MNQLVIEYFAWNQTTQDYLKDRTDIDIAFTDISNLGCMYVQMLDLKSRL